MIIDNLFIYFCKMNFSILKKDLKSNARAGEIKLNNKKIKTPIFMPVGTIGSVKGLHTHEIDNDSSAEIILSNTYHLYLRPGLEVIEMQMAYITLLDGINLLLQIVEVIKYIH